MSFYYDQDDVLPNRSPRLSPAVVNYRHEDTPPPLVPEDPSSSSCSPESVKGGGGPPNGPGGGTNRPKGRTAQSFADAVLIASLEPNRPDISREAGLHPLEKVDSDDEAFEDEPMSEPDANHVNANVVGMARKALRVTEEEPDSLMLDVPDVQPGKAEEKREEPKQNGFHNDHPASAVAPALPETGQQSQRTLDVRPPPRVPHSLAPIRTDTSKSSPNRHYDGDDSIATSPALAKFTISSANGDPDSTLPAMQMSPPRSSSVHSPESTYTLPSLQTALSMEPNNSPFPHSSHSPTMTRPSPNHVSQFRPPASSYNHASPGMSPPGIPSHPSYWRTAPREGSMSTPSDYHSTPTSGTGMTPSSTTSYTPSITTVAEHNHNHAHQRQNSLDGSSSTEAGALLNGAVQPNGPFATNSFQCNVQGCNAVPFQTQYLLNSHMNVHSSDRPHFCPRPDCPRGPGGRGFKRKNEMIRHGLVHDSPGYVCPFCPDQQHKYPRPDNLQRHVRVHHVDKDRDDPQLRHVLAQRPEGGNRGRRRRGGSTG